MLQNIYNYSKEHSYNKAIFTLGFLYAIKELYGFSLPDWASNKLDVLKTNGKRVGEYIEREEIQKTKKSLDKILPGFNQ
jgi:hypothetical protein